MDRMINQDFNNQERFKSLHSFFYRNLKNTFADLNLRNRFALEYIATVLTRFARTENLYRIKQLPKYKLESVVESLLELEASRRSEDPISENDEILIRKHVADFTLFMSGIFREYVEGHGFLDYYHMEGSRSYHRVYDFAYDAYGEDAEIFHDLSRQFENYSGALDYMKKVYFYYPNIDEAIREMLYRLLS